VHVRCDLQARDGHREVFAVGEPARSASSASICTEAAVPHAIAQNDTIAQPVAAPSELTASHSLRDADVDLIARTLKECGGNVSAAARKLRVSRGLIYRRTQRT
jgi:DNA-binding NtrC family response regulator